MTESNPGGTMFCGQCGKSIPLGSTACPYCGAPTSSRSTPPVTAPVPVPVAAPAPEATTPAPAKKTNKLLPIILAAVGAIVVIVVLALILNGPSVDKVEIENGDITLRVGDEIDLDYDIDPSKASKVKVTWSSSDSEVASINSDGTLTAKSEGTCKIKIKAKKKTDTITVTVRNSPDFESLYDTYCESKWATLAEDGSYLKIDTNPYDIDDGGDYSTLLAADAAIEKVNIAIGLPDYIYDDMQHTRALDGRQSETFEDLGLTVTWSYHPDQGLEVTYKAI